MREGLRSWLLPIALIVAALLAGGAILAASKAIARSFNLLLYLLANLVVFLDLFDFGLRLYFRRINSVTDGSSERSGTSVPLDVGRYTPYQKRLHLRPYALIVSVHNAEDYLDDFFEAMEPYRDRLWVIDDASTDSTCLRIRQAGFRCLEGRQNRKKPGAIRVLLESVPPEIETVLVLDPDTVIRDSRIKGLSHLEAVIFDFQRSGMVALCPRIAIKEDGLLGRLQGLEYCMAFCLGRQSLADHSVNSGVSIYARSALASALKKHSLSVYAEDLENSMLLLGAGEGIYYDGRLVMDTEGKRNWHDWFSQRVGWSYGLIKVYIDHFGEIRRIAWRRLSASYQFLVYMGVFSLLLHPLKLAAFLLLSLSFVRGLDSVLALGWIPEWNFADPVYFLAAFAKYMLLSLAALFAAVPRGERLRILPVVPLYFFYALIQILPTTVGYGNWFTLRLWGRRILKDHYQDEESLARQYKDRLAGRLGAA